MLAITGMQETSLLGTGYQQEVALDKLYADVAEYDTMISNPVQIRMMNRRARREGARRYNILRRASCCYLRLARACPSPQDAWTSEPSFRRVW